MSAPFPTAIATGNRLLTTADVPPEVEWLANVTNPHTRRAYENAVQVPSRAA
jgi:integrase/recombinase XerD